MPLSECNLKPAGVAYTEEAISSSLSTCQNLFQLPSGHMLKRGHSWKLLSLGSSPLSLLTMKLDGSHYLRLDRATYLIGLLGLSELVKAWGWTP